MNSLNVPTPKAINTNTSNASGVPLELLLAINNANPGNFKQLGRLFTKKDILEMTPRQVITLIRVAVASNEAEIRPHYDEFRRLARMMQGRGKRLADDITRFGLVERTRKNPEGNEHARSINHLLDGDEYLKSDPTVLQIRVLSCIRIALLALTHHRHELPFLTPNGLPADVELGAWTPTEIALTRVRELFGAPPATVGNDDSDDSDADDDSYDGSSVSAASPAPAQKGKVANTYQHPHVRSPAKPQQTETEYRARRDRITGIGAHPPTEAARAFVPSPLPPTRTTNTTNPSRAAATAPVSVQYTDSSTIYDGPIADLLSVLESITDRDERAVIQGELDQLIAAARAELASREPDYGVFASSIKSLEASKEHADPALIESIDARIASLKKAAARIAAK